MDHGIGGVDQAIVIVIGEAKVRCSQITAKDPHTGLEMLIKSRKLEVQLQGLPQTARGFLLVAGTHQQVQRGAVLLQQVRGDVCADVSGGTSQEYRHVAPLVPVLTMSALSGAASK